MERNYLLVYHNKFSDKIEYHYFESAQDMKSFIENNLKSKNFEILHKYKIKEL